MSENNDRAQEMEEFAVKPLENKLDSLKKLESALCNALRFTEHASDVDDSLMTSLHNVRSKIKSVSVELINVRALVEYERKIG